MSRLLLVGTGPLLDTGTTVMSGQCLRSWHFCAPLLEAGHRVRLATVPIPGANNESGADSETGTYQGFDYLRLRTNNPDRALARLRAEIDAFRPDAVVGINGYPSYLAARLAPTVPLWVDLNGWTLAEGVVRAAAVGHDDDYGQFWRNEVSVLLAADRISTVSERQAFATEGQLALMGMLDRLSAGEQRVVTVPNAVYPDYITLPRVPGVAPFLSDRVPRTAKVVLWSGGFNSWTDCELVTGALGDAMGECPELVFVSTGGAVLGHDEETYRRFEEAAARNMPHGRWIPLGWVDFQQVLALHATAALGLNVDGINIETRFGARNRLTNMMAAGLPVITTRGTEIAEWIERGGHGAVVPEGDRNALAEALIAVIRHPAAAEARAAAARPIACDAFAPRNTLRSFLDWAANPARRSIDPAAAMPARIRQWYTDQAARPLPFPPPSPDGSRRGILGRLRRLFR